MTQAKMMYAFDHVPVGGAANVAAYSDLPFAYSIGYYSGATGPSTGSVGVYGTGGNWLFNASGSVSSFGRSFGSWHIPITGLDTTKPRSWIGSRFIWTTSVQNLQMLAFINSAGTQTAMLVTGADYAWNLNQEYYVEVMVDWVNQTRSVWVDGALVVNAASIGAYTPASTDYISWGVAQSYGASTASGLGFKDVYLADDPADGSFVRPGPIKAYPITVANVTPWAVETATLPANVTISSAQSKFGGASASFPGAANNTITMPDDPSYRLTGDFTVEFFFNTNAFGSNNQVFVNKSNQQQIYMGTSGIITAVDDNVTNGISSSTAVTVGTWNHLALVKKSGTTTMYLNGNAVGSNTTFGTLLANTAYPLQLGTTSGGVWPLNGYMDEFRVSNVARYTAAFTPPTAQFVPDANTLILFHFDSSSNNFITNSAWSAAYALNMAQNTSTPNVPNVLMASDGITPLTGNLVAGSDPGATVLGVTLLASGLRNQATGTTLRTTIQDQAATPNKQALTPTQFPTAAFGFGKTLGFLPNALDGTNWTTEKINQISFSALATAA